MSGQEHDPTNQLFEPLTRRERDVLVLLAQGLSGPEIAEKLTLAVSSVRWHAKHLYAKLGVNSKKQAIARAHELGLLSAPPVATAPEPRLVSTLPGAPASGSSQTAAWPERRHNLPLQVTRFFGREGEVDQLIELLSENRLVTLSGPGGVGKTRLALRTAEEILHDFADGVRIVELAPLGDPALVPLQIATTLGVRDDPGRPVLEMLTNHLRERQILLVLDNCEHLLDVCAQVAGSLLRTCPLLRILATSRELLGVAGDAVFPALSLPFPKFGETVLPEALREFAALSLYLDRARLVRPDYQPSAREAAALAAIVQRLDGIPLAIEMAAARMNLLSAEQLAGRLDDVFRALSGGSRTALPRQQTLRATLDWSYRLLSEPERLVLQRLAVFAGGGTLETAEFVCSGEGIAQEDVLDLLGALVAKSMVGNERPAKGQPRYQLLETVRQYAREKLQDSGDLDRLRTRHRDYFLDMAEAGAWNIDSKAQRAWALRLIADRDNVRSALEWAYSWRRPLDAAHRFVVALPYQFWASHQENYEWHARCLALCESESAISPFVHIDFLERMGNNLALNDPPAALQFTLRALELSRQLGQAGRKNLMWDEFRLADAYLFMSNPEPAVAPLAEAEDIFRKLGPENFKPAHALLLKGNFAHAHARLEILLGRYEAALQHAAESIQLYAESESPWLSVGGHLGMATASLHLGNYQSARDHLNQALEENNNWMVERDETCYIMRCQGEVELTDGNLVNALAHCRESIRLAEAKLDFNIVASNLGLLAAIWAKQGRTIRAACLSGASKALYARQKRKAWEDSSLDTLLPGWRDGAEAPALSAAFEARLSMSPSDTVAYALSDAD